MEVQRTLTWQRYARIVVSAAALCAVAIVVSPLVGSVRVDFQRAFDDHSSLDWQIIYGARMPRTLFAAIVGGALALSGVIFQAVLRNPLASPFTLGVSGGSALGAVLAIRLGGDLRFFGFPLLPLASFAGASAVVVVVYALSRSRRHLSPVTLLLSGVVLNFLCAALILLVHYFATFTQSFLMIRWMMGGLDIFDYDILLGVAPFVVAGIVLLVYMSRYLNVLSAGEEWAETRGLDFSRLVSVLYFAASLLTGSVIAYSGPIGFVGLIVPHTVRLILGADHRVLVPACFFIGGAFLIACDALARTVLAPVEIPVGIVTAILGGPFFLWLLLTRKRELFF
jgi:iron complex transport system permease protein